MGSVILMAGEHGHRVALPNSRIMIHAGSAGFRGNTPDLEIQAREVLALRDILESIYERHTGHQRSQLRRDMERDNFMNPDEAVSYGLIDRVVEPRSIGRFGANGEA
jgi:ATP-dependent Clp protease, protease subunit